MSTSLVYHAFGVRGYVHARTEYVGGAVHFTIEQPTGVRCSACGSRRVIRRGDGYAGFDPIMRPVWIVLTVPRLECRQCGTWPVSFAPGQHHYTMRFARYVVDT